MARFGLGDLLALFVVVVIAVPIGIAVWMLAAESLFDRRRRK